MLFPLFLSASRARVNPKRRPCQPARGATVETIERRLLLSVSLLKDILSGPGSSFPTGAVTAGSQMYFVAADAPGASLPDRGLFKTDGTATGTVEVMKTGVGAPFDLTNDNGTLYFLLVDTAAPFHARLWKTDGTAAGTVAVDDLGPEEQFGNPSMAVLGTTLYYRKGDQIWKTDPTRSTAQVALSGLASEPFFQGQFGGKLLVEADKLYTFDGTTLTALGRLGGFPPAVLNGAVYFIGNAGLGQPLPFYRSDGTPGGTTVISTLPPPTATTSGPVVVAGKLLFGIDNQVYASDGSAAGTRVIESGRMLDSDPTAFATLGNKGLFVTGGPIGSQPELWTTDGTAAGTTFVNEGVTDAPRGSPTLDLYNGRIYFTAGPALSGGGGARLWQTDGTVGGTQPVDGIRYAANPTTYILGNVGNKLVFSPTDPDVGSEPFALDTSIIPPAPLAIRGTAGNDVITLSVGPGGAFLATINGATTSYAPSQYAGGITIDTGNASGSGDVLNIEGLPNVTATADGEGLLRVTIGSASRGIQDVASLPLTIGGKSSSAIKLTMNDTSDAVACSVALDLITAGVIDYTSLIGLAPGEIRFADARLTSPLIIKAGDGGNDLTLNHIPPTVVDLNTGNGADTVDLYATPAGSILNINGQNGADAVSMGDVSMDGVQNIHGVVNVSNPRGKTRLSVDDYGDYSNRTASFDTFAAPGGQIYGTLQGLAPGAINFDAAQMASVFIRGYTAALTVKNTPGGAPLTFETTEADILATAPGQVLNLNNDLASGPQTVTLDFSANRIGAGTKIFAATYKLQIIGSGANDHFTVGGAAVDHGSVSVGADSDSLSFLELMHGTFDVTGDLSLNYETDIEGADTTANVLTTQLHLQPSFFRIKDGATMVLASGADLYTEGALPTIDGKLDLGTSQWFISTPADPSAQLAQLIREGLGGSAGILSSASDATHGVGFTVSPGGVTIGYALYGDTNLDGQVDFTDLLTLAQNYGRTNAYWYQGDFNYDGKVDFADLLKLAQNYGKGAPING